MVTIQGYIKIFIIFIAITAILYLPVFFILKKKDQGFIRPLSYLFCFWSFFLIVYATLILFNLPLNFKPVLHKLNLQPFLWLWEDNLRLRIVIEIIPNIMLFIPLGIFLPTAFKRMRKLKRAALVAFIVTFSVEFFQYFIGRTSDIDDMIMNLLGGIIGYGLFRVLSYLSETKPNQAGFLRADTRIYKESI